jgi:hypothetical protein
LNLLKRSLVSHCAKHCVPIVGSLSGIGQSVLGEIHQLEDEVYSPFRPLPFRRFRADTLPEAGDPFRRIDRFVHGNPPGGNRPTIPRKSLRRHMGSIWRKLSKSQYLGKLDNFSNYAIFP